MAVLFVAHNDDFLAVKGNALNVMFWNFSRSIVEGRPKCFHSVGQHCSPNFGYSATSYISLLVGCC